MLNVGDSAGFVGLGAVAGDGGAVVAEVDVGLVAGDALACDAGALEAADEFFGFAGEHGANDGFDSAWDGVGHCAEAFVCGSVVIVNGGGVDFRSVFFWWAGDRGFCWGFCGKQRF